MNLHGVVRGAIQSVNPDTQAQVYQYQGTTTNADYSQAPQYSNPMSATIQVQPLSWGDKKLMEGLNVQGVLKSVYLYGNWNGIIRKNSSGGDYMTFTAEGINGTWRIVDVPESYPDWTRAIVCLQA